MSDNYFPTQEDIDILARTIYGEARGEYHHETGGLMSFIAVANVVLNRLQSPKRFGATIRQICHKPLQFSCWNKDDPNLDVITHVSRGDNKLFDCAYVTAEKVSTGLWPDLTQGSNHYFATSMATPPRWAIGQPMRVRIGHHLFYQL